MHYSCRIHVTTQAYQDTVRRWGAGVGVVVGWKNQVKQNQIELDKDTDDKFHLLCLSESTNAVIG